MDRQKLSMFIAHEHCKLCMIAHIVTVFFQLFSFVIFILYLMKCCHVDFNIVIETLIFYIQFFDWFNKVESQMEQEEELCYRWVKYGITANKLSLKHSY